MGLTEREVETVAQAIHEMYRKNNPGSQYDIPWESLRDDILQSNRDQANAFLEHIAFLGLAVGGEGGAERKQLSGEQIEAVAERIHDVWVRSKKETGWVLGEIRDDEKRIHPLIVSYDELPETEKDKDRAIARSIVPLLNAAGIKVFAQAGP